MRKRRQRDALVRIGGQRRQDRRHRRVDARVEHVAADVREGGIDGLGVVSHVGRQERQHAKGGERHAQPEEPGPALAPSAAGAVENDAPYRRVDGVYPARDEQDGADRRGRDLVSVGIKIRDIPNDPAEQELPGDVARGVAESCRVGGFVHERS